MLLVIASILPFPYILGTMEAIKTRMSFIVVLCSSYGANKKQKQIFLCPLVYNYNEWLSISSNYQESTNNIFKNAIDYSVSSQFHSILLNSALNRTINTQPAQFVHNFCDSYPYPSIYFTADAIFDKKDRPLSEDIY